MLEIEWEEEFSSSWCHFKEFFANTEANPVTIADATPPQKANETHPNLEAKTPEKEKEKEKDKQKDKEPPKKKLKGGAPAVNADPHVSTPNDKDAEKKKGFAKLVRDSQKLKGIFHEASSNYVSVAASIESSEDWRWASGSRRAKQLKEAHAAVKECMNAWHREYLANDFTVMRRKYTQERLAVELTSFVACKAKVETLAALITSMNAAHESIMKIS